ncbi:MAG: hypothetical protein WAJ84_05045 [Candidatus Rhabdochlamydia sp.]
MAKDAGEQVTIKKSAVVTLTDMGHIVEIQHMEKKNTTCYIKKIDADRYVNLETGEIHDFEKSSNRSESENSLRKTFKKMRYLINYNFKGNPNELFVTFTFAKESFDSKMVYKDFDKFIKRLRYKYKKTTTIDYLNVVEPHASGQWHSHMLIRFNDLDKVYIPNAELNELWGHGFVTIQSLKNVDNIGAYVSAYLADVEVPEGHDCDSANLVVKEVDGQEKRFIKGGRLWMYPPQMNLYRKSKGIEFPERVEMTYEDTKKVVGFRQPHYQKQYIVENVDFKNTITYEQYNLKR